MNPEKVVRARVKKLTDLPNVGPATAGDLRLLGIETPAQLKGKDLYALYDRLCEVTGCRQDPCVLDLFLSVTRFADGGRPRPWWAFTAERKRALEERRQRAGGRDRGPSRRGGVQKPNPVRPAAVKPGT